MQTNHFKLRHIIGLFAATATGLQSCGLGKQLYLACTLGTQDLSLFLFLSSFIGMALWAAWASMKPKPDGPELIIALPNALGAAFSLAICAVILVNLHRDNSTASSIPYDSTNTAPQAVPLVSALEPSMRVD